MPPSSLSDTTFTPVFHLHPLTSSFLRPPFFLPAGIFACATNCASCRYILLLLTRHAFPHVSQLLSSTIPEEEDTISVSSPEIDVPSSDEEDLPPLLQEEIQESSDESISDQEAQCHGCDHPRCNHGSHRLRQYRNRVFPHGVLPNLHEL